ncbi:uncharacterized protein LOC107466820 [Arachis duranensis]|uniref:Uncharacterized protein LOC107466820 n=1 Tax=Arachis duranensis TaxID=130453 RepID=A0A6P4C2T2_ARADU|nr:uncharacterized protein LOC107466820 [Arachis duranensis]XP_015941309.1 uncharacterized protein LOC107466820 [Arachis duranensis]XP_020986761.1 uncharacterized protein LOC107466820 [Arachis duranensis]
MTCTSLSLSAAPKFSGDKYDFWKIKMRRFLVANELWEIVDNGFEVPVANAQLNDGQQQTLRENSSKDAKALFTIQSVVSDKVFPTIMNATTAKEAWDTLQLGYHRTKEVRTDYNPEYARLYAALRTGDWHGTREFLNGHEGALTARISHEGKRALHVAALFGHRHIVEQLLQLMSADNVKLRDNRGLTALHEATYGKDVQLVKCLVEKGNRELLTIPSNTGWIPLTRALSVGNKEMAAYLFSVTPWEELTPEKGYNGVRILIMCYYSQILLDKAQELLRYCPKLAVIPLPASHRGRESTLLEALASVPSAFPSGRQLTFWERWIFRRRRNICKVDKSKLTYKHPRELLEIACKELFKLNIAELENSRAHLAVIQAAKMGIPEFIKEVIKTHPRVFWAGENPRNAIFVGVEYRQASVFDLIHGMVWKNALAEMTDRNGDTLLHMAGLLAPSAQLHDISGAALQMQRELQWFKEVESITPALRKQSLNNDKKTARQLFTEEHKDLVKQGEKWMKGTATSFSLVAALVATVVFAAAFTVPGGNDQITGYPIFSKKKAFVVFVLSDAISLFSSSTSIIMFLGILTSRYAEDDFLKALPLKLITGLLTLFISMASMLVAFSAALFVMLHGKAWIVIPLSFLACVPIASFIWLQFPLFVEITMSTFGPSIFDRNANKHWLTR